MILPARRLFLALGACTVVAVLVSVDPDWRTVWYGTIALLTVIALADLLHLFMIPLPQAQRHVPHSLPLGVKRLVRLQVHNRSKRRLQVWLYDHFPLQARADGFPLPLVLPADKFATTRYTLTAHARGRLRFPCLQLRLLSALQLWWRDVKLPVTSEVKVYPNFAAVAQYALLATDNHLSHMGIMKKRRRGEGQDFHQLREYRAGDSLRQIDWKASARLHKAISREYQDERDQEIVFLLDCGHRMMARDDELSHFDHTLNAILLLTYVALRQGDAVGLGTFAGNNRWLPARKGQHHVQYLLNALYDLQATTEAPDYAQAATALLVRQKKRALVILLTNLRDEDLDDLLPALHLLRKRHLVLLASMRESILDTTLSRPVDSHETAIHQAAVQHYLHQRNAALERIRTVGIRCLDTPPDTLSISLVNHYLDIKRSAVL